MKAGSLVAYYAPMIAYCGVVLWAGHKEMGSRYRIAALCTWALYTLYMLVVVMSLPYGQPRPPVGAIMYSVVAATYVGGLSHLVLTTGHRLAPTPLARTVLFVLFIPWLVLSWMVIAIFPACFLLGDCL